MPSTLFLSYPADPLTGKKYRMVAGTIRRTSPTSWEVVNDAGHDSTGIQSVTVVDASRVRIGFDFTATKVLTFSSTLDESFAASTTLLRVGSSVALTHADVLFYTTASGSTPVDPGTLSRVGANVWIFGVFEVP